MMMDKAQSSFFRPAFSVLHIHLTRKKLATVDTTSWMMNSGAPQA